MKVPDIDASNSNPSSQLLSSPRHVLGFLGVLTQFFIIKLSQIITCLFSFPFPELLVEQLHIEVEGFHEEVPGGVHQADRGKDDHCGAINCRFIVGNGH